MTDTITGKVGELVTRYDPAIARDRYSEDLSAYMSDDVNGEYVQYSDYATLLARVEALEAERAEAIHARDRWEARFWKMDANFDRANIRAHAAEAKAGALQGALKGCFCPRPANSRPDHFTVGECVAADECGCCDGAPLLPTLPTNAEEGHEA